MTRLSKRQQTNFDSAGTLAPPAKVRRASSRASRLAPRASSAFTLIELLITITIIAILAAAILGASQAALGTAKASRTRTTISKLHLLLMDRLASYETRQVEVNPLLVQALEASLRDGTIQTPTEFGQIMTDLRLFAKRELMRLEMPDRWADVKVEPNSVFFLSAQPPLSRTYWRRLNGLSADADAILENQSAECLYMTVMLATGDGEARTQFSEQDIGDVDGDGAPEFLDGWGQPIQYIRWPAGFAGVSDVMTGDGEVDHDPFDPFRRDAPGVFLPDANLYPGAARDMVIQMRRRNARVAQNGPISNSSSGTPEYESAFRLVPLVFSAGPDGDPDLNMGLLDFEPRRLNDPYVKKQSSAVAQLGVPVDATVNADSEDELWKDNIHNHVLEY